MSRVVIHHPLCAEPWTRWRTLAQLVLALILLLGVCASARADASSSAFEAANKLYEEGKFTDAAAAYEKLALSGQGSAALYFNLGNSFFKAGQIGRAIGAYRQAEQIAPRDPDISANLRFARRQIAGPTVESTRVQQWLGRVTLNEWTLLAAGVFWILFLLLAAGQWRPAVRPTLRLWVAVFGFATVFLGGCLCAAVYQRHFTRTAIVIAHDVVVRLGPLAESQEAYTVHDGAELRVVDQKDEWLAVTAGPNRFGWLRRDQVLLSH